MFLYKMTIDFNVSNFFLEDQIGGNVKSCFFVPKQCENFLMDLKDYGEVI